jgi:hypothetical protein
MEERREVVTGLRVETSHLNQLRTLPVEVNPETFV